MRLEVKKTKSKPKRITEAKFEGKFASALTRASIFSWHTSEKFIAGIPDRYVVRGNWLEFKVIPYTGKRQITPQRFFSAEQKLWMNKLARGGDRVFACILFQPENDRARVLLCPWDVLKDHGPMKPSEIERCTYIVITEEEFDMLVSLRFSRQYTGYSNYEMKLIV